MNPITTQTPFPRLRRTPLYELHRECGGSLNPWGGFEIPSHFTSILEEHEAALGSMALFDLGYRCYVRLQGPEATAMLEELSTFELREMPVGAAWEIPFVYPDGTLVDLPRICREEEQNYLIVFRNNSEKPLRWVADQIQGANCYLDDLSEQYSWVGLSGERAQEYLEGFSKSLTLLKKHQRFDTLIAGVAASVWHVGSNYYEISCQPELLFKMIAQWRRTDNRLKLCGWASYENWRLENGVLRWGMELKDGVGPYEVGLDKKVMLQKQKFIGKSALEQAQKDGLKHMLVHFYIDAMRLPRVNSPIYFADKMVGKVVSGGYSPSLKRPIGSGWVACEEVDFDRLEVEIRRQRFALNIKNPPLR